MGPPQSASTAAQDKPTKLAFGVEPQKRAYRLRLARYPAIAEAVAEFAREQLAAGAARVDLLDLGVGKGRSLRYLETHAEARQIRMHGMDLSPKRLGDIYRPEAWRLAIADLRYPLPFPSRCFDVVLCEQVLEHLDHPERVVAEIARVLRPGALLVAGVPTFPPGVAALRHHLVPIVDAARGLQRGHLQVFTARSFAALVSGAGAFEITALRGFSSLSGGLLAPLENLRWWWRLNAALGARLPSICTEVQVVARRTGAKRA